MEDVEGKTRFVTSDRSRSRVSTVGNACAVMICCAGSVYNEYKPNPGYRF